MSGSFDATTQAITIRQGETLLVNFTHKNADASALDVSGDKFRLTLKKSGSTTLDLISGAPRLDPLGSNPFDAALSPTQSSITMIDGAINRWSLRLSAVCTENLAAGIHQYEIDRIQSDGTVFTSLAGDFEVVKGLN